MASGDGSYVFWCLVTCFWGLVLGNMYFDDSFHVICCWILLCQVLGALFADKLAHANVHRTPPVLRGMSPGQRLAQRVWPKIEPETHRLTQRKLRGASVAAVRSETLTKPLLLRVGVGSSERSAGSFRILDFNPCLFFVFKNSASGPVQSE